MTDPVNFEDYIALSIDVWTCMVEWAQYTTRRKLRLSDQNVSQCHIVHHKSHTQWLKTAFGAAAWARAWESVVVCCVHRDKSVKLILPGGKILSRNTQSDRNMEGQNYKRWIYTKMQEKMWHEHTSSKAWFLSYWLLKIADNDVTLPTLGFRAGLSRLTTDCLNLWKIPGAVRVISNTWCVRCVICCCINSIPYILMYVPCFMCNLLFRPTNAQNTNNKVSTVKYSHKLRYIYINFRKSLVIYDKVTISVKLQNQ